MSKESLNEEIDTAENWNNISDDDLGLLKEMNYKNYILGKSLLIEGIEEIKKYYPLIPETKLHKLISFDPTYKGGNELGTYGKWILNLFNNYMKDKIALDKWQEQKEQGNNYPEPIKKSQDNLEDFDKLSNLLKQFDNIKSKTKLNINNIKSISELSQVVEDAVKNDNSLSTNPQVQKVLDLVNKSVAKGGEIVFRDDKWIILVPKTLESSIVFGNDTKWCTTTPNGYYYNKYLKDYGGQYFINVNLQDGSLYQFHFESDQFVDSSDNGIDVVKFAKNNQDLKSLYRNYIVNNILNNKNSASDYYTWIWVDSKDIPEQVQLEAVKKYDDAIKYIVNPSKKVQMEAVINSIYALDYIQNPSEKVLLAAINKNSNAIQYVKNPSEEMQLEAVKREPHTLKLIKNPTEKVILTAVKLNGNAINYVNNPSEKLQLLAVKNNGQSLQLIKNPTEKVQLAAINKNGFAIQYVKNPSEEMQLIAIKQDPDSIHYIKNPSEKVQLEAVKAKGSTIQYIENPSEEMKLDAIKQDPDSIQYIKKPSEKLQLIAIKDYPMAIKYINRPTEKVQLLAIKNYSDSIEYIKKPTDKIIEIWHQLYGKKDMFESLNISKTILIEGIEEIKKYYPLIPEDSIRKLMLCDPTYVRGNNELGTYGKWILNLYNNYMKDIQAIKKWQEQKKQGKNYPEPRPLSHDLPEDFNKLPNLLEKFDAIKNKAKLNINNIKSISELYQTIQNNTKNDNISTNKQVQHSLDLVNKSVAKGGEIVFKDDKWIVLVPTTYESSKIFGDDTNWCTTSHNGEYYDYYKNKHGGKYFINVNLQDGSLYQFHFESEQLMDNSDEQIESEQFAKNNPDLKQFYRNYILNNVDSKVKKLSSNWVWLNPEDITEEMQMEAVTEDDPYNGLENIIKAGVTPLEKVQIISVQQTPSSIYSLYDNNIKPSEEVQIAAVKQNGHAIGYIENPSEKVQLEAVKNDGFALQFIKHPTKKIQLEAIKSNGYAIDFIKNPTEEMQLIAVENQPYAIQSIENPSEKVQMMAVKNDPYILRHIKNPTEKVQIEAVKKNTINLNYIENPSEKVQMEAIKQRWDSIKDIKNPTEKVQLLAITINREAIDLIKNPTDKVKKEWQKLYGKKMNETVNFDFKLQLNNKWNYGSSNDEIKSYIKRTLTETFGNNYLSTNKNDNKSFNNTMTIHCITNKIPTNKLASVFNKIKMLENKGFTSCKSDFTINVYNVKYNLQDYIWEQCNTALNEAHYNCENQLMTKNKQQFIESLSKLLKENDYSNIKLLIDNNKEMLESFIKNNKKTLVIKNFDNSSKEDLLQLGQTLKNIQESSKFKESYIIQESIDGMNKKSFMNLLF